MTYFVFQKKFSEHGTDLNTHLLITSQMNDPLRAMVIRAHAFVVSFLGTIEL